MAEFRLLGPVEVWAAGVRLDAGHPRQRAVLAALLVDAGRLVTWETLTDRIWGDSPVAGARQALYSHVARIRRMLERVGEGSLERHAGGYLLAISPELIDFHRYRRLVRRTREKECDATEKAALLREAVSLWRGEPLAGVAGEWAARTRDGCRRFHLDTMVAWARSEVLAGNAGQVVEPLADLLGDYPLVEPLAATLIEALHQAGHTARALEVYADMRRRLVEELGADPGVELLEAHRTVLRQQDQTPSTATLLTMPAQLPRDVPGFAGRTTELTRLGEMLSASTDSAVAIAAIVGTAGVGKTALAVHWAHRNAGSFPDGQLYVNLRGFDPAGAATPPAEAVRGFLDALGVLPQRIPPTFDAQVGLYRSLLAGRRMLIVLDNARHPDQVRPLLPGTATSMVVVTSRNDLIGLISTDGAVPISVTVLAPEDAEQLLMNRMGAAAITAEPAAAQEISRWCAHLPLALVIVAARALAHPEFPLSVLAGQLAHASSSLDVLAGIDPATNVRAVLSWSYQTLAPESARMFRLLSLHPGPDIGVAVAASLGAVTVSRASLLLAELAQANLVLEHASGRYAFHDLLRAYAGDLAMDLDSDHARRDALHRMLDHYLHTAFVADRSLYPRRDPVAIEPALPAALPTVYNGHEEALSWFAAEHRPLLGAIVLAAGEGFHTHAWQLAWAMDTFLDRRGHWHDWIDAQTVALEATQRLGDRSAQAGAHRGIAAANIWLGRHDIAATHLDQALEPLVGRSAARANIMLDVAWMFERQDRHESAITSAEEALGLYRANSNQAGEARALNAIGWSNAVLGNFAGAIEHCRSALALLQGIGDRAGEAHTWDSLGYANHSHGDFAEAVACYVWAADLFCNLGDRYYEAATLGRLGEAHNDAGAPSAARESWQRALDILEELDHPDARQIRAKLDTLLSDMDGH